MLAGADVAPSSASSAQINGTCVALITEMSEGKRRHRKAVLKRGELEKASIAYIIGFQGIIAAGDGEQVMMLNMLKSTQYNTPVDV